MVFVAREYSINIFEVLFVAVSGGDRFSVALELNIDLRNNEISIPLVTGIGLVVEVLSHGYFDVRVRKSLGDEGDILPSRFHGIVVILLVVLLGNLIYQLLSLR